MRKFSFLGFFLMLSCTSSGKGYLVHPQLAEQKFQNCQRYFDGCNTCTREPSGQYSCTELYCDQKIVQKPRCLDKLPGQL